MVSKEHHLVQMECFKAFLDTHEEVCPLDERPGGQTVSSLEAYVCSSTPGDIIPELSSRHPFAHSKRRPR